MIFELLKNVDLLLQKIKERNKDCIINVISGSWEPCIKCSYSGQVTIEDVFLSLLFQWLKFQKENSAYIVGGHQIKGRSSKVLLSELFGTSDLSTLKTKQIENYDCNEIIEEDFICDGETEKRRQKECESFKKAEVIILNCKNNNILYFCKTKLFYFLISEKYINIRRPPVYKEIEPLLFCGEKPHQIRKRPGMYIGSTGEIGIYRLLSGLMEDLLHDAVEKVISLKLYSQNVCEVSCESYFIKNNTLRYHHLEIVNALSEFFEYQDSHDRIRTEKGSIIINDNSTQVETGIKLMFKLDDIIFDDIQLDYYMILNRMLELAILNPYTIYLSNNENQNKIVVPSGIGMLLKRSVCMDFISDNNIIPIDVVSDCCTGKIAISFSPICGDIRESYINNYITQDGGTHVEGVIKGAYKALEKILKLYNNNIVPQDLMVNFNYVIHIQIKNPRYYGATKRKLINLEVKPVIKKQVEQQLYCALKTDIAPLKSIYFNAF